MRISRRSRRRTGELSRRDFLKAVPLALLASGCETPPYDPAVFSRSSSSPVALLPATRYDSDLSDVIRRGLTMLQIDVRGKRVFLKPNMVEYEADTIINTNPHVVAAAADALLTAGAAQVTVGEGPGHRRDVEYLLQGTGMGDFLDDLRIRFVDLNHDDVQATPLASRYTGMNALWLPRTLLDADFIVSMPKLKTHHWAGMTASMKNLFGVVPGAVYGWPKNLLHVKGIEQSIIDLTATVRPQLTIVDAIVAMEGNGPIMGKPRAMGFIAMGQDLLAVDATLARVIGLSPERMPYLSVAGRFLGNIDQRRIEQRGEPPSRYATRFEILPTMGRFVL